MARARNIKPSFFTNEQLADNDPLGRLLFIGLWTLADYKGDLEWKERTIKIQILPWDNCDIKQLAINLDKSGLIRFYSDGDKIYINIPNFERHQNPHKNERDKGSDFPAYSKALRQVVDLTTLTINRELIQINHDNSTSDPAESLLLNPESLILNPDLLKPESEDICETAEQDSKTKKSRKAPATPIPENFSVSDRVNTWASKNGFGFLDKRLEHFRGLAIAKGYVYADWDQAFMNAIRDDWAKLSNLPAHHSNEDQSGHPEYTDSLPNEIPLVDGLPPCHPIDWSAKS